MTAEEEWENEQSHGNEEDDGFLQDDDLYNPFFSEFPGEIELNAQEDGLFDELEEPENEEIDLRTEEEQRWSLSSSAFV